MPTQGVVYMLTGNRHGPRLAVSVYNLRKFYTGDIVFFLPTGEENEPVELIAKDPRIVAKIVPFRLERNGKGAVYANKAKIPLITPFERTIFLDADTLPVADLEELWPAQNELVLVQMSNWTTQRDLIKRRINKWREIVPTLVERALSGTLAAINTGVFAFDAETLDLSDWARLCKQNPIHICDEIAMQLLYPDYPHRLLDDSFNCCPVQGANKEKVKLWHFHTRTHLRLSARPYWLTAYQECLEEDVGKIRNWTPAEDEALQNYLERHP
jgi:hypothetical protein